MANTISQMENQFRKLNNVIGSLIIIIMIKSSSKDKNIIRIKYYMKW